MLRLAAGLVDALLEVTAAVEEPDADERQPELGRALQVVAGEDTEAAGVDRQALLDAEFHAEVRDEEIAPGIAVSATPPAGRVGRGVDGSRGQGFGATPEAAA